MKGLGGLDWIQANMLAQIVKKFNPNPMPNWVFGTELNH